MTSDHAHGLITRAYCANELIHLDDSRLPQELVPKVFRYDWERCIKEHDLMVWGNQPDDSLKRLLELWRQKLARLQGPGRVT
jgi:hypothetical protein